MIVQDWKQLRQNAKENIKISSKTLKTFAQYVLKPSVDWLRLIFKPWSLKRVLSFCRWSQQVDYSLASWLLLALFTCSASTTEHPKSELLFSIERNLATTILVSCETEERYSLCFKSAPTCESVRKCIPSRRLCRKRPILLILLHTEPKSKENRPKDTREKCR